MGAGSYDWVDLEAELRGVLAEGIDIRGTIEEADIHGELGDTTIELVIELSDVEGDDQSDAYLVLCDLLTTRSGQGADQVLGCLVFVTDPDAGALAVGLDRMTRDTGVFTPIVPLGRSQAALLAVSCITGAEFLEQASERIAAAAEPNPATRAAAQALLDDLAELINRHTSPPPRVR